MAELYIASLDAARPAFGRVFRLLAGQSEGACLFHCTAGKDRTGMVAMLLLGLAGVPDEVIVADYAATENYMAEVSAGIRARMTALGVQVPDYTLRADPESMRATLAHLREKFGDAASYLRLCGVPEEELERLRARLSAPKE